MKPGPTRVSTRAPTAELRPADDPLPSTQARPSRSIGRSARGRRRTSLRTAGPDLVLLHDVFVPDARPDEDDTQAQVALIADELSRRGLRCRQVSASLDLATTRALLAARPPDLVFNLCETVDRANRLAPLVPALLDELGLAYTGSTAEVMLLTTHKVLTKRLLVAAGLPTPPWHTDATLAAGAKVEPGVWLLKPIGEDASVGLDDDAVVTVRDADDLRRRLQQRARLLRVPVFAEAFIDGREFNLSLLHGPDGFEVLPAAEMEFIDYGPERPRIVGYAAKWDVDSFECTHTQRRFADAPEDAELVARLGALSEQALTLFGVRAYGRADFRIDAEGQPWLVDLNTNPSLSPDAGFVASAQQAGLSMGDLLLRIIGEAGARAARPLWCVEAARPRIEVSR